MMSKKAKTTSPSGLFLIFNVLFFLLVCEPAQCAQGLTIAPEASTDSNSKGGSKSAPHTPRGVTKSSSPTSGGATNSSPPPAVGGTGKSPPPTPVGGGDQFPAPAPVGGDGGESPPVGGDGGESPPVGGDGGEPPEPEPEPQNCTCPVSVKGIAACALVLTTGIGRAFLVRTCCKQLRQLAGKGVISSCLCRLFKGNKKFRSAKIDIPSAIRTVLDDCALSTYTTPPYSQRTTNIAEFHY